MAIADKLTTISAALQNIKTAVTGKGVTIDGDITTYADAIASIPIGVQLVTGQVSGSGSRTLTIADAIGKDNIVIYLINTSSSSASVSTPISASVIGSDKNVTYKNSGNLVKADATWDKTAGTMTLTSAIQSFSNNANIRYAYVAW